jgi:hypothetical protein
MNQNEEEFILRKEELIEAGDYQGEGQVLLKLIFGNHYEQIDSPHGEYEN